jgi:hypothetical protein
VSCCKDNCCKENCFFHVSIISLSGRLKWRWITSTLQLKTIVQFILKNMCQHDRHVTSLQRYYIITISLFIIMQLCNIPEQELTQGVGKYTSRVSDRRYRKFVTLWSEEPDAMTAQRNFRTIFRPDGTIVVKLLNKRTKNDYLLPWNLEAIKPE